MTIPIRVLIVEDSAADAELMLGNLTDHGFAPHAERVETEAAYLAALDAVPEVILADYRLPRFSGSRALELLNGRRHDIPFIVLSGSISDVEAANLIKAGACDFLLKDRLARLGPAVAQALKLKDARDKRRRSEAALAARSAELETALQEAWENAARYRVLTETAMDAILTIDEHQNIVLFNAAAERMFGCSAAEVIGQPLDRLLPGSLRAAHREHVRRFHGGASAMARDTAIFGLRADGTQFPVEVSIAQVKIAQGTFYTAILRDITGRKQAEEALRQLAGELRTRNEELTRSNRYMAGRELRMIELKQQVNDLAAKLGLPQPYALAFMDAAAVQTVRAAPKLAESPSSSEPSQASNQKE